jgi:protoporphyrinogen oxidase
MSDTIEFMTFPPLNLIDKFRLGLTIFVASKLKNWKQLEKIPVTNWLKKWSGHSTFNKIWLPLLRAKLGENYQKTSAAFIWTTIQRMYAARRSGLKKEMFGYVSGGYAQIIESFKNILKAEGVLLKPNHEANEIRSVPGQKPTIIFAQSYAEVFDNIIITLPSDIASNICKALLTAEKSKLNGTRYLGVICACIVLEQSVSPYYVTNITDAWVPFTGIIEMSALVDKRNFGGKALIYLPKYLDQDDSLFEAPDEDIKKLFLSSILQMYPQLSKGDVKFIGVARAKRVLALPTLNYSEQLPDIKTSMPGVYILNASHITGGTLNVDETIRIAETKLEEILKATII